MHWYTTVIKTRLLFDGKVCVGHIRNIGKKQWYAEVYKKQNLVFDNLADAKVWCKKIYSED
jgi:hypothetical protein